MQKVDKQHESTPKPPQSTGGHDQTNSFQEPPQVNVSFDGENSQSQIPPRSLIDSYHKLQSQLDVDNETFKSAPQVKIRDNGILHDAPDISTMQQEEQPIGDQDDVKSIDQSLLNVTDKSDIQSQVKKVVSYEVFVFFSFCQQEDDQEEQNDVFEEVTESKNQYQPVQSNYKRKIDTVQEEVDVQSSNSQVFFKKKGASGTRTKMSSFEEKGGGATTPVKDVFQIGNEDGNNQINQSPVFNMQVQQEKQLSDENEQQNKSNVNPVKKMSSNLKEKQSLLLSCNLSFMSVQKQYIEQTSNEPYELQQSKDMQNQDILATQEPGKQTSTKKTLFQQSLTFKEASIAPRMLDLQQHQLLLQEKDINSKNQLPTDSKYSTPTKNSLSQAVRAAHDEGKRAQQPQRSQTNPSPHVSPRESPIRSSVKTKKEIEVEQIGAIVEQQDYNSLKSNPSSTSNNKMKLKNGSHKINSYSKKSYAHSRTTQGIETPFSSQYQSNDPISVQQQLQIPIKDSPKYSRHMPDIRKSRQESIGDLIKPPSSIGFGSTMQGKKMMTEQEKILMRKEKQDLQMQENIKKTYIAPNQLEKMSCVSPQLWNKVEAMNAWHQSKKVTDNGDNYGIDKHRKSNPQEKRRVVGKGKGSCGEFMFLDRVMSPQPDSLRDDKPKGRNSINYNPKEGKNQAWNTYYSSSMTGSYKALGVRQSQEQKGINQFPKTVSNMNLVLQQGSTQNQRNSMISPRQVPKSHQSYRSNVNDFALKSKQFNSAKMMGSPNMETKRRCNADQRVKDFYQSRIF